MNAELGKDFRLDADAIMPSDRRTIQRAITAMVLATARGGDPIALAKQAWPDDRRIAAVIRAAVHPTTTADYPVMNVIGLFQSLAPKSAALQLFGHGRHVDLTGLSTIAIPSAGALPPSPFVAESAPGPVVDLAMGDFVVGPTRKILIMAAVTRELDNATPQGAVNVVSGILGDAVAKSLDAAAFGVAAADATMPAGLLYNVTPLTASALADPFDALAEDLGAIAEAIGDAGIDTEDLVFVAGPREAVAIRYFAGSKFTYPIYSSIALKGKIAGFAAQAVAAAYAGLPQVETSKETALHFDDTNPAPISQAGPTVAHPVYSAFQQELIAIKVRARAAWGVHPGGAQVVDVTW